MLSAFDVTSKLIGWNFCNGNPVWEKKIRGPGGARGGQRWQRNPNVKYWMSEYIFMLWRIDLDNGLKDFNCEGRVGWLALYAL